ncbi:MAG TPA: hypothetical protein VEY51_17640 [Chondromyces sp.]|nr:hypothetical protein [Chondromyces sp.]
MEMNRLKLEVYIIGHEVAGIKNKRGHGTDIFEDCYIIDENANEVFWNELTSRLAKRE